MEYPESEELQEVYESLSAAHLENKLLQRERDGLQAHVDALLAVNADLLAALQNLVSAVDAARKAEYVVIKSHEQDETLAALAAAEDAEATVIMRENEARAVIAKAVQP